MRGKPNESNAEFRIQNSEFRIQNSEKKQRLGMSLNLFSILNSEFCVLTCLGREDDAWADVVFMRAPHSPFYIPPLTSIRR